MSAANDFKVLTVAAIDKVVPIRAIVATVVRCRRPGQSPRWSVESAPNPCRVSVELMPFTSTSRGRFFHEESGEGDAIVFLAGLGGDHRAFSAAIRRFAETRRTIGFDSRDSGGSDRFSEVYTTGDMADDVAAWLDIKGIASVTLVGHSLGGLIAQEFAIRHPGRVRGLALVSTHAFADPWKRALVESWVTARRLATPESFARITLPWLVAPRFYEVRGQAEGLIRFAERNDRPQEAEAFARQAAAACSHDTRDRLTSISIPTLVVNGDRDLVNSVEVARGLAEGIEGARFEVMRDVGHLPHIEDGPGFRALLANFLETVRAR